MSSSLRTAAGPSLLAGRDAAAESSSDFVLLADDWRQIDDGDRCAEHDQLTHEQDVGDDLTTALLVDAADGARPDRPEVLPRLRIESFFKLLKSHGQELEHWPQASGAAIMRRLLVAAMACVVVRPLQRDDSPDAEGAKAMLMLLSGRSTKPARPMTASGLLAGSMPLLSLADLLEHTDVDLRTLKRLAKAASRSSTPPRCVDPSAQGERPGLTPQRRTG